MRGFLRHPLKFVVLAGLLSAAPALAVNRTWTGAGADDNWTTAANWGGTAPSAGDDLFFPGPTPRLTPNNDFPAGTLFSSITFTGTGGYTLVGNAITLGGGVAANNTSGFNCRYAVGSGPRRWSVHAYGLAIDVNPVENPYLESGRVHPRAGRAYLDRTNVRPGMAVRGGLLVSAFRSVGWRWGGRWTGTPDYQHFSATGG